MLQSRLLHHKKQEVKNTGRNRSDLKTGAELNDGCAMTVYNNRKRGPVLNQIACGWVELLFQ